MKILADRRDNGHPLCSLNEAIQPVMFRTSAIGNDHWLYQRKSTGFLKYLTGAFVPRITGSSHFSAPDISRITLTARLALKSHLRQRTLVRFATNLPPLPCSLYRLHTSLMNQPFRRFSMLTRGVSSSVLIACLASRWPICAEGSSDANSASSVALSCMAPS